MPPAWAVKDAWVATVQAAAATAASSSAQILAAMYRQMGSIIAGDRAIFSALKFPAVQANCQVPAHVRNATRDQPVGQKVECPAFGGTFQPLMTAYGSAGGTTGAAQPSLTRQPCFEQDWDAPLLSEAGYAELTSQVHAASYKGPTAAALRVKGGGS